MKLVYQLGAGLLYFLTPIPFILLYLWGQPVEMFQVPGAAEYLFSQILGLEAFVFLANQLYLASKPKWLEKLWGTKILLGFHGIMALVALGLAAAHRSLKVDLGMGETPAALMGTAMFSLFALVVLVSLLLFANTFITRWAPVKAFKEAVYKRFGWTYKGLRVFHNLTVVALVGITLHALAASSTQSDWVRGAALGAWFLANFVPYLLYRLRGRKAAAPGAGRA